MNKQPDWENEDDIEAILREAIYELNTPDVLGIPDNETLKKEITLSPRFQKRMGKLLASPFKYAKRAARPKWVKVVRAVACLLLAVTVTFGTLYAVSPQVRAWVNRVIEEWNDTNMEIMFTVINENVVELGTWEPHYVPTGYNRETTTNVSIRQKIIYYNSSGDKIIFNYALVSAGRLMDIDSENADYETITINEQDAYLFKAHESGDYSYLTWFDGSGARVFYLMGKVNYLELINMAESVEQIN